MKNTKALLTATATIVAATVGTGVISNQHSVKAATINTNSAQETNDAINQAQQNLANQTKNVQSAQAADSQAEQDLSAAESNYSQASQASQVASQVVVSDQATVASASNAYATTSAAAENQGQVEEQLSSAQSEQAAINQQNSQGQLEQANSEAQQNLTAAQTAQQQATQANTQAQANLHTAEQNLKNAGQSQDVTTQNLINPPAGYKDEFAGGRGLVDAIQPVLLNGDHGQPVVFMPHDYVWTVEGVQSPTFTDLNSFIDHFNQSAENDGDHHLVFFYDDGNQLHQTSDVNVVWQHTDRPVSAYIASNNGLTDPYSTAFQMPTSIEYYKYEDGMTPDHYAKYGYAKTWDAVPDEFKANARPVYNTDLSYVDNPTLEAVTVPDALNLSPDVQAALTEYAANLINHFNEQAGFAGRAVANSVAIQKTNTVAQKQTDSRNHEADHLSAVGSYGENMALDFLTDTNNVSLNTLYKKVHDAVLDMLFPNIGEGADWLHAQTFYNCEEPAPGNPAFTTANPAKLGVAFDQFGNLHFDFYNPADAAFQNSQDYTSGAQTDTSALQAAVTDAQNKVNAAQRVLTQANQKLADAQTAMKNANATLSKWRQQKDAADQKVKNLENDLQHATRAGVQAALAKLNTAKKQLAQAQKQQVTAANNLSQATKALTDAKHQKSQTAQVLVKAQAALSQSQHELAGQQAIHGTRPTNPVQPTTHSTMPSSENTNSGQAVTDNSNPGIMPTDQTSQANTNISDSATLPSNQATLASGTTIQFPQAPANQHEVTKTTYDQESNADQAATQLMPVQLASTGNNEPKQSIASAAPNQDNLNNRLPQTGNHNSLWALLSAVLSMICGLGLARKEAKRDN